MHTLKSYLGAIVIMVFFYQCTPSSESTMETSHDIHSFAKPAEAVMNHLKLDIKVDFDHQEISGIAAVFYKAAPEAKLLILDTKNLSIEKVTSSSGQDLAFQLKPAVEHLGQALEISINPTDSVVLILYKTQQGAEALQWLSAEQTADKTHPFLFTQSQAILARTWIPLQDSPGIRFTYEATVKVPSDLLALMSAYNPIKKNEKGIYNFKMDKPIPAYLMALAVGNVEFASVGSRSGIYAEPSMMQRCAYELADMEKMLEAAEKLYGSYQWGRYDVIVLPPSFPFGGMENPMLTFATPTIIAGDRSLTSLIAHELAHSWSGNLVTNATWNDFWLNEGFTVYFEQRIMESVYGKSYSEMLAYLEMQNLLEEIEDMNQHGASADTRLKLDLAGRNPDDGVTSIAYNKGYFFLRTLEGVFGREQFDEVLTTYFNTNAFKSMTTEGFITFMEVQVKQYGLASQKELMNQWIFQEGLPEARPVLSAERFELVDQAITNWQNGTDPASLTTNQWSTHEWVYFIRSLPADISIEQLTALDQALGFTASGNSELLSSWFLHVIRKQYEPAYDQLAQFLINTGRRKFLSPLYAELLKTEAGKQQALEIYKQARPNYHFVASNTIDKMLNWK